MSSGYWRKPSQESPLDDETDDKNHIARNKKKSKASGPIKKKI